MTVAASTLHEANEKLEGELLYTIAPAGAAGLQTPGVRPGVAKAWVDRRDDPDRRRLVLDGRRRRRGIPG
jgi:hypothetical protein